jgi:hypothetical protein
MIRLSFDGTLRDQGERPCDDAVAMRRGIDAIMAQHQLDAFGRRLDRDMMAAIRRGQQRRHRQCQRSAGEQVEQHQATRANPTQGRQGARN